MSVRGAFPWLVAIVVMIGGCSQRRVAEERVARIGASRLLLAADSLSGMRPLPRTLSRAAWPATLRALKPQAVWVGKEGVFVRLEQRFVEEAGVFVAFAGIQPSVGPEYEPAFTLLAPRVYWYRIKG